MTPDDPQADALRALNDDLERRVALRTEELVRMNQELRSSEARYREVVNAQNEFIVRWRPDGTRTFVNDAYCRFLGASASELLGMRFFPLLHSEDRPNFEERLADVSAQNPTFQFEGRIQRRDGMFAWLQWESHAFFDERGQVVEYQSVGRDVSQLKEASDLLRQKEAHLAHLSRLATMGEMVAGIVHEISQPLHAAKTFAEAARRNLESSRPDGVQRAIECTGEISQAVNRTVRIVRRLREFTRAQPFELELLAVNQLVRESLELVSHECRRLGIELRSQLAPSLPPISGDRTQLDQLLVNLLKNACEAMENTPSGERVLDIRTSRENGHVEVVIRDSGTGLSPDQLNRLFEPFYTTKLEGMGMGLPISKSIADAHDIHMTIENNRHGSGLSVILRIPAIAADSDGKSL
jgi:PAS domain S-box-containing protein